MLDVSYADLLRAHGFQQIGEINYRLQMTAWWNPAPERRLQVLVLNVGGCALIKGDKSYLLKSVSKEGETWARDVKMLHHYLESHFPELRLSFSHFRNVPPALAKAEVDRRASAESAIEQVPSIEQIAQLQRQLDAKKRGLRGTENLLSLSDSAPDLLSGYTRRQINSEEKEIVELEAQLQRHQNRLSLFRHLQREYERKGSAASYSFSISSHLQVVENPHRFADALRAVIKELLDQHRYEVTQKLQGGRLNIQVAEAEEPVLTWLEMWMGGALSPAQLQKLPPAFDPLRRAAERRTMVTPDEPIVVDGHVRHAEKHLAARVVSTMLQRIDKTDTGRRHDALDPARMSAEAMPLKVGLRVDDAGHALGPAILPLAEFVHAAVCGTTGSGKSFFARVLVEEASRYQRLNILILDPRNQFAGLLVPEDRTQVLQRYAEFGMKPEQARGLPFSYFAPAMRSVPPLPENLAALATGRAVVSFKEMDDAERCTLAAKILQAAFVAASASESEFPRLLILVDESQLMTRKRVDESAKEAAGRTERALDKIAREGRKYGIVLTLISQTIKDFAHELASLRQMTNTKIFFRNSDNEIDYASDIIGDGRLLVQLPNAQAIVHNARWGVQRINVRPPYSKVQELPESELRRLVGNEALGGPGLSAEQRRLLSLIENYRACDGSPLYLTMVAELAGITSRRKLHELINDLERLGRIRTRKLPVRGQPRIIEIDAKAGSRCP